MERIPYMPPRSSQTHVLHQGKYTRFMVRNTWEYVERIASSGIVIIVPITDENEIVPVVGEPGDVCFFDCNIVHGSNHNFSPVPRRSMIYAYGAMDNQPSGVEKPRPDWVVSRHCEPVTADLEVPAATG